MLVVFFIMLREGMEAALIVGIVASFLKQSGNSAFLPKMWFGVISAIIVCLIGGYLINALIGEFPSKQQGIISGIIALIAVFMLTYMVLWMKTAAKNMKKHLQDSISEALSHDNKASWALVATAFLAVMREGTETVFFLLAVAQNNTAYNIIVGGVLGFIVAVIMGWLIYEGGIRINLGRFFRWTGVFLIVVAAGLFSAAFRNFHNAGLWNIWQHQIADLSWLLRETTTVGTLFHGLLGYTDKPTLNDAVFWFAYLIPVLYFFLKPVKSNTPAKS